MGLTLRTSTNIRARVEAFVGVECVAMAVLMPGGQWTQTRLNLPGAAFEGGDVRVLLGVRLEPLTRGHHLEQPQLLVDFFQVDGAPALRLAPKAVAVLAILPLGVALFLFAVGAAPAAIPAAIVAAAAALFLAMRFPLPVLAALPPLVLPALLAGAAVAWLLRRVPEAGRADRAALAALVAAAAIVHGSLAFFPGHCPEDRDTHAVRARDLSEIELSYDGLMRYGSQRRAVSVRADGLLRVPRVAPAGTGPHLGPHRLQHPRRHGGHTMAMARRPAGLGPRGAMVAALLYTLDLAPWHQVGRARGPTVFGAAMMAVALGYLVLWTDRGGRKGRITAALLLGSAARGAELPDCSRGAPSTSSSATSRA